MPAQSHWPESGVVSESTHSRCTAERMTKMPRCLPFVFLIRLIVSRGRIRIVFIVTNAIIMTPEFVTRVEVTSMAEQLTRRRFGAAICVATITPLAGCGGGGGGDEDGEEPAGGDNETEEDGGLAGNDNETDNETNENAENDETGEVGGINETNESNETNET